MITDLSDRIDLIINEIENMDIDERIETLLILHEVFCMECGWKRNDSGYCQCDGNLLQSNDEEPY